MPERVVLLHGFSGTHRAFDGVIDRLDRERYLPQALDLPGHGHAADSERPITFGGCVARVLAAAPPSFSLCGYSLGGRVALHVALAAPERVRALLLISCSPGIEDPLERAARSAADRQLAQELQERPFEEFIERWRGQPLFADEPPEVGELARADQRRNHPRALAAALRGLGTGEMQAQWQRLGELQMPVSVMAGARDAKFRAIAERMVGEIPGARLLIAPGGHGLLLENPQAVADALASLRPPQ